MRNLKKNTGSFTTITEEEINSLQEESNPHHVPEVQRTIQKLSLVWMSESSSKILPKLFQKRHIYAKIIWIIFFVCSSTISLALVIKYVKDYLEYKVDVKVEIIYESPTKFPAVTFCNLNPFHKERAQNTLNFSHLFNFSSILSNETSVSLISSQEEMIRASTIINLSPIDRKYIGHQIEDMLISCFYNGISCSEKNFSISYNYYFGNCFTFNGDFDSIKQTSISGVQSGLQIEVLIGNLYTSELYNYKNGLHVIVHNQTMQPLIESEGIEVPSGRQTNIAIRRTFITKLGLPYNDCINNFNETKSDFNSSLYSTLFNVFNSTKYRQKNCLNICYQTKIVQDCNCTDPKFSYHAENETENIEYLKPCASTEQIKCLVQSIKDYQINSISEECFNYCKLDCDSIFYSHSSSSSSYPSKSYAKKLALEKKIVKQMSKNASDFELLKYSILKLNVFYEDMTFQFIGESPGIV